MKNRIFENTVDLLAEYEPVIVKEIVVHKPDIQVLYGNCVQLMSQMQDESVNLVISSPPYNLKKSYNQYKDDVPRSVYLDWIRMVFRQISRVLKSNGSFFLNMGSSSKDAWIAIDVANVARELFVLQNEITWVKSITVNGTTHGHFTPINSNRYLNWTNERIYHFTKDGKREINRLAIGVPYTCKSNVSRWKSKHDIRCAGNSWFIAYETIFDKAQRGNHPATFPVQLPENCIKLHGITEGMLVLDPFVGTGTTLVAAQRLGVNAIGMEIDEKYIDVAKRRLGI